jgi:hypothetical protein
MNSMPEMQAIDTVVAAIAIVVNLLMIGIFVSRPFGWRRLERVPGSIMIVLALPVLAAVLLNLNSGRAWWTAVLPLPFVVFCGVELALDYVLHIPFRHTRLLGPYLALYYLALMGLIGYAFGVREGYGFAALGAYLLGLLATWYSYARVGHGVVE